MRQRLAWTVMMLAVATASDGAQKAAPAATPATPAAPGAESGPTPPPDYGYRTDGRRDPFVSLIDTGTGDTARALSLGTKRPPGIAGLLVEQVVVKGIVETRGTWVAMVGSPDGKTYSVRPGDQLLDGTVREVTHQAVIIMQEVKDPLSLARRREVRKYLRGAEEAK